MIWAPVFFILEMGRDYHITPVVRMIVPLADVERVSESVMFVLAFALGALILHWPGRRSNKFTVEEDSNRPYAVMRLGDKVSWQGIIVLSVMVGLVIAGNQLALSGLRDVHAPEWAYYLLGLVGLGGGAWLTLYVVSHFPRK